MMIFEQCRRLHAIAPAPYRNEAQTWLVDVLLWLHGLTTAVVTEVDVALDRLAAMITLAHRLWCLVVAVCVAAVILGALCGSAGASSLVTPGLYEGTTDEHCTPEFASSGECRLGSKLPMSFTVTSTRVSDVRAMVVEHCEDFLAPRIEVVEVRTSIPLKHVWGPRAGARRIFDSNPGQTGTMLGNRALGAVHRAVAHGYLSGLTKVADDTYCFNHGVEWTAAPHAHAEPWPTLPPSPPVNVTPHPALLQECAAAMRRGAPRVVRPLQMFHAGIWPLTIHHGFRGQQTTTGAVDIPSMPAACAAEYSRHSAQTLQRRYKGRWITACRCTLDETTAEHPDQPAKWPLYDTCTAGGKFDKMRVGISSKLVREALGRIETATKNWYFPLAVHGNCAVAARSARRVHQLQHKWFGTPL